MLHPVVPLLSYAPLGLGKEHCSLHLYQCKHFVYHWAMCIFYMKWQSRIKYRSYINQYIDQLPPLWNLCQQSDFTSHYAIATTFSFFFEGMFTAENFVDQLLRSSCSPVLICKFRDCLASLDLRHYRHLLCNFWSSIDFSVIYEFVNCGSDP